MAVGVYQYLTIYIGSHIRIELCSVQTVHCLVKRAMKIILKTISKSVNMFKEDD